ncbi:MAG: helix-turn-helix domain-containing protein [Clostridiales bacterium]|nr:helix-turn-helix domain-containing protein [Clostridiales bacterium]
MSKTRKHRRKQQYGRSMSGNLLPYEIIVAATAGDAAAVNIVLKHFEDYITKLSTRTGYDSAGRYYSFVNEDMRRRLETKLILTIPEFDLDYRK